ncbi:D-alanyl-D-alanine carboxypeptidase family protein [Halobacillus sp. H74]|uniref:D-alanyl-D-alanine carboxypeptidase family protein n=1 Tax=Halobacillus sp. H74 TaxID=3457436 RepID=UPI003FCE3CCA
MGRVKLQSLLSRSIRNMGEVHSSVKDKAILIVRKAYFEGINVQISSGFRSFDRQRELFNQGRYGNSGNIVTHAEPGQSVHNYGLAIDYFLTTWDGSTAKWTVNNDWKRIAEIGKSLGFSWGGDWKWKDYPHLELTGGLSWRDLKAGKRPDHLLNKGTTQEGHSGYESYKTQKDLKDAGYNLSVDGIFGPETDRVLRKFQKEHDLEVDGLYGPNTKAMVDKVKKGYVAADKITEEEKQMEKNLKETGFKDVEKDSLLQKEITKAKKARITVGVGNDLFKPDQKVTRAEAVAFAVRAVESATGQEIKI